MHRHPNPVGDEREILREGGVPPHRPSGERSWSHRGGQPIEPGCRIAACPVDGRYSAGPLAFVVDLNRGIREADQVGVALPLPVSLTAELGVTTAQTEHMPFYLRVFFRVLSSWVHGEKSWTRARLTDLSHCPPREPSWSMERFFSPILLRGPLPFASGTRDRRAAASGPHADQVVAGRRLTAPTISFPFSLAIGVPVRMSPVFTASPS
jgi:hypothetical protein